MVTHEKEEICTLFGRRGRISIFYTDKEGLAAKVVHVLVEPVILNRTIFSREAVLGQTSSSISCATMKCFTFFLWVSLATFMNLTITDKSSKKCSAFSSFFCVKTIQSTYPGGVGGQVEWFNDLVFTVVRVAVSVVGSGVVISVLRVEEDLVIS